MGQKGLQGKVREAVVRYLRLNECQRVREESSAIYVCSLKHGSGRYSYSLTGGVLFLATATAFGIAAPGADPGSVSSRVQYCRSGSRFLAWGDDFQARAMLALSL